MAQRSLQHILLNWLHRTQLGIWTHSLLLQMHCTWNFEVICIKYGTKDFTQKFHALESQHLKQWLRGAQWCSSTPSLETAVPNRQWFCQDVTGSTPTLPLSRASVFQTISIFSHTNWHQVKWYLISSFKNVTFNCQHITTTLTLSNCGIWTAGHPTLP
jgi:hypothetical protein